MNLFAVDIGNSFIKTAFFKFSNEISLKIKPTSICVETTSRFSDLDKWLQSSEVASAVFNPFSSFFWIISSVNQEKTDSFLQWLKCHRSQDCVHLLTINEIPMTFCYDEPSKLGIDRAVVAYGALLTQPSNKPFIIVDVGTAVTVDYVDCSGIFRGGAILPGPQISMQALAEKTEKLSQILFDQQVVDQNNKKFGSFYPATNTENAIRTGIDYSLAGTVFAFFIKTVVQNKLFVLNNADKNQYEYKKSNKENEIPSIIITGRGDQVWEKHLRTLFAETHLFYQKKFEPEIKKYPHLILSTLCILAQQMIKEKNNIFMKNS